MRLQIESEMNKRAWIISPIARWQDSVPASARDAATEALLNQTVFRLSGAEWDAFVSALDNPPPPNAKLKALLARTAPWDD
jgi:uncharacterized protein (DUF1778 family)